MRIQNKKHEIYRVNGGKEYKASRLGGLERVCGGEKVVIRARERKEEKPICSTFMKCPSGINSLLVLKPRLFGRIVYL